MYCTLSPEFIEKHKDTVSWEEISLYQALPAWFIDKYHDLVNWADVSSYQVLPSWIIDKYKDLVDWDGLSEWQTLDLWFIHKHKARVNWHKISYHQLLTEKFIEDHLDYIDWRGISVAQPLSLRFLKKHADKIDWSAVCVWQTLTEDFIEEHRNYVYWLAILVYQPVSEAFIDKHIKQEDIGFILTHRDISAEWIEKWTENCGDTCNWRTLSARQRLPVNLIRKHADKVDWWTIAKCQNIPEGLLGDCIPPSRFLDICLQAHKDSCHYKSTEEKKMMVQDTHLFECHKDYFIGYINVTWQRRSQWVDRHTYLPGSVHTGWADMHKDRHPFGLCVYPRQHLLESKRRKDQLIAVRVNYEDVGCVSAIHDGIRCFQLTVLE